MTSENEPWCNDLFARCRTYIFTTVENRGSRKLPEESQKKSRKQQPTPGEAIGVVVGIRKHKTKQGEGYQKTTKQQKQLNNRNKTQKNIQA